MSYYSPQSFRLLPTGVKNLLIINGLFYLALIVFRRTGNPMLLTFYDSLVLYPLGDGFHLWQLLSYQFVHANFSHLFFNMFALWMFGNTLENYWGTKNFILYYLLCGLGAGLTCIFMGNPTVGASGAVYGLLLAFGMMFPNERIYLYFLVPIKAKRFDIIFSALELIDGLLYTGDGIAHFAHLGGMVAGFIILMFWRWRAKRNMYY